MVGQRFSVSVCFLGLALAISPVLSRADTFTWNGGNGDYDNPANWTNTTGGAPPPPGIGDRIELDVAGTHVITLTSNEVADTLVGLNGNFAFFSDSTAVQTLKLASGDADANISGATVQIGMRDAPVFLNLPNVVSGGGLSTSVLNIGSQADGTLIVNGPNSRLEVLGATAHSLGFSGNRGELIVEQDAFARIGNPIIGGGSLNVGESSNNFSIGDVRVRTGGTLEIDDLDIAPLTSGATGAVSVIDPNSSINQTPAGARVTIGSSSGGFGLLQVINSAVFNSGTGAININSTGMLFVSSGDFLTNDGFPAGGTFNANGPVTIASGGQVTIDRGQFNAAAGLDNTGGGQIDLFTGAVLTITGGVFDANDPNLDAPTFSIGDSAVAGAPEVRIENGATANVSTNLFVGESGEGVLTVTGGAELNNTLGGLGFNALTSIGRDDVGTLRIEQGSLVDSGDIAIIGDSAGGDGLVVVTGESGGGTPSTWSIDRTLTVGNQGDGELRIEDGGVVNSNFGQFGLSTIADQAASNSSVTVAGADSEWNHNGNLRLGNFGDANLSVNSGGAVTTSLTTIGVENGSFSIASVDGAGSTWIDAQQLVIGERGNGTLLVSRGAVVTAPSAILADETGSGADVTVAGVDAVWNVGVTTIGRIGNAQVRISDGGLINASSTIIASASGSLGRVTVNEAGTLAVTGTLRVGNAGDALLEITDNEGTLGLGLGTPGLVTVTGAVTIGGLGSIDMDGGRLEFGSMSIDDFGQITGNSGSLAGDLDPLTGVNDAAALPAALSGSGLDVSEVRLVNNGLLFGAGSVDVALNNSTIGEVETSIGDRLHFRGVGNSNAGEINNFGGQIRFDGDATNQATGFIAGRGQFIADGGWTNQGAMAFSAGPADILGDFVNASGGQVVTSAGATTTFFDDLEHNGAEIRTAVGSAMIVFGAASGAGAYTGGGTVFFEGDLRPGNSPDVVTFGGDVSLGDAAVTFIELGGAALGEFDRLDIAGDIQLSGALEVTLIGDYAPALGDALEIIATGGDRNGTFVGETLPDLGPLVQMEVRYLMDAVLLVVTPTLAGDYNADGAVSATDYAIWRESLGLTGVGLAADGNGDGQVNTADYNLWRANFGATIPALISTSVPEPSTAMLITMLALGLAARRKG